MKTWLFSLVVALAWISLASAQTPVLESQKQAIALFPDLAVAGSKFNKRFLQLITAQRATDASFLQRDDWPLVIAKRTAADLGLEVAAEPPGAAHSTALDQPVGQVTLHGSVLQRMDDGLLIGLSNGHGTVLLRGFEAKEGKTITVPAMKAGPYDYTDLEGVRRRIDSFQALK